MSAPAETTPRSRWRGPGPTIQVIFAAIALVIVIAIVFIVFEANRSNAIVDPFIDIGGFFAEPFKGIFSLSDPEGQVALNWGIGAVAYLGVGALLARLFRR